MVDKRLKIIPKGEEFNSSLPSCTPDYASLYFENYILDKDTNEKILMENPLLSNLKKIPVPDDFVKALLVSQTAITTDHQMESSGKIFKCYGPLKELETGLLKLWKYL